MSENISEYVKAAKQGSQHAFSKLFELTNQSAYYTALKITKKQQDAEDIVQDAYIKAFTSLDLLTDDNKFESWFNCIVANKCRDLLKKKKPDLFSKFETDDSELAFEDTLENQDISLLPQSVTENEATHQLVMECIEKLPDEQRVCIVMFYYDELSVKEIALTLEIPEGTVKSRLSKARKTLKKEFENIEERDKIKLHALPYVPLLRWAFENPSKSDCAAKTIYHRILKNVLKNMSQSGKLAKGVGILSSTAVVKIVSVVVAVSVAVTAAGFGIKDYINSRGTQNNDDAAIRTDISDTTETDNSASYYSESPLAVYSRDKKSIYYVSDDGIIQKSTAQKAKIIANHVPDNLVFTDRLMYLFQGALYSYDDSGLHKLQNADGALLYAYDNLLFSISADRKSAYTINPNHKSSAKWNIKGNQFRFIDGYIYYYDSGVNLCRASADGESEVVIPSSYTKGFKSVYSVKDDRIYFSGFDSDASGIIYTALLGSDKISELKLDDDGIRDFTVIGSNIYYSTYTGAFNIKALNGSSHYIADRYCYNLCNSASYTVWADMDTGEVFILEAGSTQMHKTEIPNTITDFEVIENILYYSTNEERNNSTLTTGA